MPLTLNSGRPKQSARRGRWQTPDSTVSIGLVNNMPDAALQDTEAQFSALLAAAAGDLPVQIRFYALPEIARGDQARRYIAEFYSSFNGIQNDGLDALVITGTEPREQNLRNETYWPTLARLLDWAENETCSAFLSCLASHASVLHSNGIERRRLAQKRFGVFEEQRVSDGELMSDIRATVRMPHSRWNDLREEDLKSQGYTVITKSREGGVGLFAKQKRKSLFIYSQGHPEYSTYTLLKEYRRDIKRFVSGHQLTLPTMPEGYFDLESKGLLDKLQQEMLTDPSQATTFPFDTVAETVRNGWHATGIVLFRNWLRWIERRKCDSTRLGSTKHHSARLHPGLKATATRVRAKGATS